MKRIIGLLIIFVLAFPLASLAGEPAWWTQKKRECGLSPSLAYNTWVSQGSPCKKGGGSPGGISSGSGLTPSQQLGVGILGAIINDASRRNEESARQQAEDNARAAEESRRAEEEALRRSEEKKDRLLKGMLNVGDSSQLGLMGVETGSGLGLMTDASAAPPAKGAPPADKNANQPKSEAYTKGFEHASRCISQNTASVCVAGQPQTCAADYRTGYDLGSKQRELVLREAYQAGQSAGARGELSNGGADERAQGPCRLDWIQSYNRGHWQGKNAKQP